MGEGEEGGAWGKKKKRKREGKCAISDDTGRGRSLAIASGNSLIPK